MIIPPNELRKLLMQHNVNISGILHIGSHLCEEKEIYNNILHIDDSNIIWIDAIDEITQVNKQRGIPNCYTAVLDETERDTTFKITRNEKKNDFSLMSSSLLDLGTHKTDYPDIVVVCEIPVRTQTLCQFIDRNSIDIKKFNVWNIDVQGSELSIFRGSKELLKYADCIYSEVNTQEVYKGCGQLHDLDTLLIEEGFERVYTEIYESKGWGDAIYIRKNIVK
jgi:FkbM family methyltransferase